MKKKNLAFTLAEVLIVIGIIGVVAALTLPNLNHATGDKETVTRLQKAYSILNEANDRAVAIYGPISTWKSNEQCAEKIDSCWMKRIGEFLKISKSCDEDNNISCDSLLSGDMSHNGVIHQLPDGTTFSADGIYVDCDDMFGMPDGWAAIDDICLDEIMVDLNGPTKGKNVQGYDIFKFILSDSIGLLAIKDGTTFYDDVSGCMSFKDAYECTWWVLEYGNLDYLKADEEGKCNDSNIILDGVTNTSCH